MSEGAVGSAGGVRPDGLAAGADRTWPGEVARYYDRNTRRFLLVGRGRGSHSMHRELWGPGVECARGAVDHINALLAEEIDARTTASRPTIIDFGCGVGGTLFHLARRFPGAKLVGVTVSARQVATAERLARGLDLHARCSFSCGDFQTLSLGERADAVVAVESFAHADSAARFLDNANRHLKPGGYLILADDFLATEEASLDSRQRMLVDRFRTGWRVPGVDSVQRLADAAARRSFETARVVDLTSLTRPGSRARDRLIAAMGPVLARLGLARIPFYGNMIGGGALQVGLREGFLRYALVVLRKVA